MIQSIRNFYSGRSALIVCLVGPPAWRRQLMN